MMQWCHDLYFRYGIEGNIQSMVTAVTVAGKGRRGSMRMRIRHLTHVEERYYTMDRKNDTMNKAQDTQLDVFQQVLKLIHIIISL